MWRLTALFILTSLIFLPSTGYSQWDLFEHRYEYKLDDVLDADRFVQKDGYWEGYREDRLEGYVFLSPEWTAKLLGYSGKHMETLIGMDTNGILTGVRLLFHSEPIVLIGLKEKNYQKFLEQYPGKDIRRDLSLGKGISMDSITGATVTAVIQNAIVLRSARRVASLTGTIEYARGEKRGIKDKYSKLSWKELLDTGAIRNISVSYKELGLEGSGAYIDLFFGVATVPSIGRNILGDRLYNETVGRLDEGESVIFVLSRGEGSFKGSGFARGGVFDRMNMEQEDRVYVFSERDYRILTDVEAEGAPEMREGGLFKVRGDDFDPTNPFKFNFILPYRERAKKEFRYFSSDGKIPDRFLE